MYVHEVLDYKIGLNTSEQLPTTAGQRTHANCISATHTRCMDRTVAGQQTRCGQYFTYELAVFDMSTICHSVRLTRATRLLTYVTARR